jgi:hypothetical protein
LHHIGVVVISLHIIPTLSWVKTRYPLDILPPANVIPLQSVGGLVNNESSRSNL